MSEPEKQPDIDEHSGVETTGHSWDGITELNNPLPRWWLYIWYMTIIWALIYMVLMPALPALPGLGTNSKGLRGHSDRADVAVAMADLDTQRQANSSALLEATLEQIETDRNLQQFALAMGESLFGDNCATCHGAGGRGAKGYPVLADDDWLWDGTLDGIEYTLRHGIRHTPNAETRFSEMPAYGKQGFLTGDQVDDVTEYVLSLSGRSRVLGAAERGAETYQTQCAACHGPAGKGDRNQGAPNLTDPIWLYGSERQDVYNSIYNAWNSHMPAWENRLDDASIKALAVYVHALSGGE